jgi:pimeloyl-ACP methyl ester carboxylesterase
MATCNINGINMFYREQGEGPPLLCIAGLGATHEFWLPLTALLAADYHVVVFDNRGIGETDDPESPVSIGQLADDAVALMDALQITRAPILGHSMGTSIALDLAARYPDRVQALILCNAFIQIRLSALFAFRTNTMLWERDLPGDLLYRAIMPWLFTNAFFENREQIQQLLQYVKNNPPQQTVTSFQHQLDALEVFDAAKLLPAVASPTLVISGTQDIMTPPVQGKELAQRLKQGEYGTVDSAHASVLEHPGDVYPLIGDFLKRVS